MLQIFHMWRLKNEDQQKMWRLSVKIAFLSAKIVKSTLAGQTPILSDFVLRMFMFVMGGQLFLGIYAIELICSWPSSYSPLPGISLCTLVRATMTLWWWLSMSDRIIERFCKRDNSIKWLFTYVYAHVTWLFSIALADYADCWCSTELSGKNVCSNWQYSSVTGFPSWVLLNLHQF